MDPGLLKNSTMSFFNMFASSSTIYSQTPALTSTVIAPNSAGSDIITPELDADTPYSSNFSKDVSETPVSSNAVRHDRKRRFGFVLRERDHNKPKNVPLMPIENTWDRFNVVTPGTETSVKRRRVEGEGETRKGKKFYSYREYSTDNDSWETYHMDCNEIKEQNIHHISENDDSNDHETPRLTKKFKRMKKLFSECNENQVKECSIEDKNRENFYTKIRNDVVCDEVSVISQQRKLLFPQFKLDSIPETEDVESNLMDLKDLQISNVTSITENVCSKVKNNAVCDDLCLKTKNDTSQLTQQQDRNAITESTPKRCLEDVVTDTRRVKQVKRESGMTPKKRSPQKNKENLWDNRMGKMLKNLEKLADKVKCEFLPPTEVDILVQLGEKSGHFPVVSKILEYLSTFDLINLTYVSKSWRNICYQDKKANLRLKHFFSGRMQTKENPILKQKSDVPTSTTSTSQRYPGETTPVKVRRPLSMLKVHNFVTPTVPVKPSISPTISPGKKKFNLFIKEASKLDKNGKLVKCPKCKSPSRVDETKSVGKCTSETCSYYFCVKCLCSHHQNSKCDFIIRSPSPSKNGPNVKIYSQQSRKALRRL